jgi:hypothetical protein
MYYQMAPYKGPSEPNRVNRPSVWWEIGRGHSRAYWKVQPIFDCKFTFQMPSLAVLVVEVLP